VQVGSLTKNEAMMSRENMRRCLHKWNDLKNTAFDALLATAGVRLIFL